MPEREGLTPPPETELAEQIQPQADTVETKKEAVMEKAWNMLSETQQQALVDNVFSGEKDFAQIAGKPDFGEARERGIAKTMHKGIARSDKLVKTQAEQAYDAYYQKSPDNFIQKMEQKIAKMEADIVALNKLLETDRPYNPAQVEDITLTIRHLEEYALPWLRQILEQKKSPVENPENQEEIERWQRLESIIARELGEESGSEAKNVVKTLADLGLDFVETTFNKPNRRGQEEAFIRTTLFANPLNEQMPQDLQQDLEKSGYDEGVNRFTNHMLKFLIQKKIAKPTVEAILQLIGFTKESVDKKGQKQNIASKFHYSNQEEGKAILELLNGIEKIPFATYIQSDIRSLNNMMWIEGQSGITHLRHHRLETAPTYGDDDQTQFFASPVLSFENKMN